MRGSETHAALLVEAHLQAILSAGLDIHVEREGGGKADFADRLRELLEALVVVGGA